MIEINNLTKFKINKKTFSTVAKKVLLSENKRTKKISLAFISKAEIKKLNKKFRRKNKATDVLSFEGINEVVICPEIVKEKEEKLEQVFLHGILHLLGYDHEKSEKEALIMENKEKFYLNKFYA